MPLKKPLRYREIVTTRRVTVAVISAFAFSIFVTTQESILAAVNSDTNIYSIYLTISTITVTSFASISIIAIVGIYLYIFSETRRQQRIEIEHLSVEEITTIRKNNKATKVLGIILITLIATYLPIIISVIVYFSVNLEGRFLNCMASWVATLIMLGALCNPIIYCWRMEKFRHAFLEILHLRSSENNQRQEAIEVPVSQPAH